MSSPEVVKLRRLVTRLVGAEKMVSYDTAQKAVEKFVHLAEHGKLEGADLTAFSTLQEAGYINKGIGPKTGRGGVRRGAGRTTEDSAEVFRRNVSVDQETVDFFESLSNGNFSLGIRRARTFLQQLLNDEATRAYVQRLIEGESNGRN